MPAPYVLGAVDYQPHVREVWADFTVWFREQGLALELRYFDTYDEQLKRCSTANSTRHGPPASLTSKPCSGRAQPPARWPCAIPIAAGAA